MHFGINLGGGDRRGQSREEGLAARLAKARLAKEMGYHSLWTGAGYLNNDFHALMLLARVAAEAPGLELGMVARAGPERVVLGGKVPPSLATVRDQPWPWRPR